MANNSFSSIDHSQSVNETKTDDSKHEANGFPFLAPAPITECLVAYAREHGETLLLSELDRKSLSMIYGSFLIDLPVFSPTLFFEILNCTSNNTEISQVFARMIKNGLIKSLSLRNYSVDATVRNVYYLTAKGHRDITSSTFSGSHPFSSKRGQRLMNNALHDLGIGAVYLSFARSPFIVNSVYEQSLMFDKAAMPSGKQMKRAHRPDARFDYYSNITQGTIFLEHDTKSESKKILLDKLKEYYSHRFMRAGSNGHSDDSSMFNQNMILITVRLSIDNLHYCFSPSRVASLVDVMDKLDEGATLKTLEDKLNGDELDGIDKKYLLPVISAFKDYTPAYSEKWTKEKLSDYSLSLKTRNNKYYIDFLKSHQQKKAHSRRDELIKLLTADYDKIEWGSKDNSTEYFTVLMEMLHGFPVCIVGYNCLDRLLPCFFMEDYPDVIKWLQDVLRPYYGEITYENRFRDFDGQESFFPFLRMYNIFSTSTNETLSIEYLSGDISSIMKLYCIGKRNFDFSNPGFKSVYIVDSLKDAVKIVDMVQKEFKIGNSTLFGGKNYDISFLTVNGKFLFSIDKNDKMVRVNPNSVK